MSIYIASDHRGVELKIKLVEELKNKYPVVVSNVANEPEDDYPDFAFDVCTRMSKEEDYAVLICGNGVGISIAANKVKGVRCGRVLTLEDAKAAKEHNYANAISIPADMPLETALEIIETLINTPNSPIDRHKRRVNKIISYEEGTYNEL